MLYSVTIEDPDNLPFKYASGLKTFEKGKTYEFKPGVNIIVGPNGCGKSTLINMIAAFAFCERSSISKVPSGDGQCVLRWPKLFTESLDDKAGIKDGAKIKMDWCGKVFRYMTAKDMPHGAEQDSADNLFQYFSGASSSTGETTMQGVNALFKQMFGMHEYNFPIKDIKNTKKIANSYWSERIDKLLHYYQDNQILPSQEEFEYTVLMDEPDRNLDIKNSKEILNILSVHKEMTQIVAVVHNPALLYRLSKNKNINFVEMEPGYIDMVKKFIEG